MTPCPSCNLEGRLNAVSRPLYSAERGLPLTKGCEDCGGKGHVPKDVRPRRHDESEREYRSRVYRDPYEEGATDRVIARLTAGQTSPLTA